MCLDFYKDLENYIQENRYEQQNQEIIHHFDVIEELVQQHGLYSLDFDTDRIHKLIDSISDYIKVKDIEKRIIEISVGEDQCNKSEDEDDYDAEDLRINVRKLPLNNEKKGSMGLVGTGDSRLNSSNRLNS